MRCEGEEKSRQGVKDEGRKEGMKRKRKRGEREERVKGSDESR